MKSLTIILTTISFLALKTAESAAQPPLRLEPIEVQDVSEGLPSSTPDWELEIGKYFEGQDDEEPADAELIPLGESEQEAKEKSKQKDKDELEEDKDESDEEQSEEDEEKAAQAARKRATQSQLQLLHKPLYDIQLAAGINRSEVPENQAASLSPTLPATLISTSGVPSLPQRYTVCISHRPLYYEDANLERCGNGHGCLQNAYSGVRFFSTTLVLACKMGRQCPDQLVCTLGDCKTCQSFPARTDVSPGFRGNVHGLLSEAAALAGFSLLVL